MTLLHSSVALLFTLTQDRRAKHSASRGVRNGRLAPLTPVGEPLNWVFFPPLGSQAMADVPLSEIITLADHLTVGQVRTLLNRSALDDIHDATTALPTAVNDTGRSAQRFEVVVRPVQAGVTRMAGVRGQDIYAVTAPIVIEAALRLMAPSYGNSGALSLAEAVDPVELLRALHGSALDVIGDTLPIQTY